MVSLWIDVLSLFRLGLIGILEDRIEASVNNLVDSINGLLLGIARIFEGRLKWCICNRH
jgi:hypothetical protein